MKFIIDWVARVLNDAQTVTLVLLLAVISAGVLLFGRMLAPVLAGLVIAYLLEGLVRTLQRLGLPRQPAVIAVFLGFSVFVVFVLFGPLPLLSRQATDLAQKLPDMLLRGQNYLASLPEHYPEFVSSEQIAQFITMIKGELAGLGQSILSWSVASVFGLITLIVYLVLVPVLVFFFLKDKTRLLDWLHQLLPADRALANRVWHDIDQQIGNYVRGKFWEVLINWAVCYVTFAALALEYAMLLSFMVGLSVIVPYIGAAVVTVPVAVVALFQWGIGPDFYWVMGAYAAIMILDGNVLVPWMFSEVVDLHPIAIIVAVLLFGGLWGFWGVFFAIPLATVVQAVLKAWPRAAAEVAA